MQQLKDCLHGLNRICSCQKQRKSQKQEECNVMYINFIAKRASDLTNYFRTKTTDDEITFSYGGSHVITTIKLR